VRPATYASYQRVVQLHLIPGLGHLRLARLSALEVQRYLNQKTEDGASPRLVQYIHSILRNALNRAVKWQLVPRNVATLVDPPRGGGVAIHPLAPDAAARLLEAGRHHPHEYLYALMLATGLRVGEALALRWQDVDLDKGLLGVRHTLERLPGQPWRLTEPKSASGRRTIPLIGPAMVALRAQRARQAETRLHLGEAWQDHGFVFSSGLGTPLDGMNVLHQYKKLLAIAGLPTTHRLHDLRHSTATYLLAAGVPARVVMEMLGHSQISLTLNTYSHVLPAMLDDAAKRLEAIFPTAVSHAG